MSGTGNQSGVSEGWRVVKSKTKKCPTCHAALVTEVNASSTVMIKYCSNDNCDYAITKHGEFS
jgi:hypothetical protein